MTGKNARRFRFGVQAQGMGSRDEWVARAFLAERLGYDTWLMADHFIDRFGLFTALAVAAEATVSLRVGAFVCANDYRHPVMLAKEAATLDVLSDGRCELGLGAGWLRDEYEAAGLPFDPPGVRVDRLAEAVTIIKGLFGSAPVNFVGEHYQVRLSGSPQPVQRPRPPLLIGGGSRRLLTLGAREADIVGINPRANPAGGLERGDIDAASVARKAGWIREAAGLRWEDLEVNIAIVGAAISEDRHHAAAPFVEQLGRDEEAILDSPHLLIGTVAEIAERVQTLRERYGISYFVVQERFMRTLAPVVERLRGA